MKTIQLPGYITMNDVTVPIDDVIYLHGWILHRVHSSTVTTGDDVTMTINISGWLPRLRAFKAMTYLRTSLLHHNEIMKSTVTGDDQFEITLVGSLNDEIIIKLNDEVNNGLLNDDVIMKHDKNDDFVRNNKHYLSMLKSDIGGMMATKVKRRGSGRTIVYAVTGDKLIQLNNCQQMLHNRYHEIQHQLSLLDRTCVTNVKLLSNKVGKLIYDVNAAEISYSNKLTWRKHLENISAHLNTTHKKLTKSA